MPAHRIPIDSEKLRDHYQSAYLKILRSKYPDRYAKLEQVYEPLTQITAKGGDAGLAITLALSQNAEQVLKKRPWLSKKMGMTLELLSSLQAYLVEWYDVLNLPVKASAWAMMALGQYHVEPDPHFKIDMNGPSPKDFLFNRWQPARQTRTAYLKDVEQWMNWYMDRVEKSLGDQTQTTWTKDSQLNTRNLEWVAWTMIEKLSLQKIVDRMADPRDFREIVDKTTVSKALTKTMSLLDLDC